ncbi:ABC transporter substrate-binding protein [Actinomyces haliotis]|uniref:ABC transporter substrate-binding protein n=1 Tax=Actinomyces haliotis TaxID=1280843 RepID=UPI0018903251|nr:ABC transporter substrate-binding protein [Actinomyces haliotis]
MRVPTAHRALGVIAGLALATGLAGCTNAADWSASGSDTASSSSGANEGYDTSAIKEQADIAALLPKDALADGVLDIGTSTAYPPGEFLNADGTPIGYEVDLTHAIARVLGVKTTTHSAAFDSIISSIGSKYDLGVAAMTITTERESAVDMISYINVGSQFDVQSGNPKKIDPSHTMNLCGLTIGVQTGTGQETELGTDSQTCQDAGEPAIQVRSYSKQSEAATALVGGTIDATYSDSTVAGYAVQLTDGQVETVGDVVDALPQGIAVSKDDPQLTKAVQAAVQYLMDEGIWRDILSSWGVKDAALSKAELNPSVGG